MIPGGMQIDPFFYRRPWQRGCRALVWVSRLSDKLDQHAKSCQLPFAHLDRLAPAPWIIGQRNRSARGASILSTRGGQHLIDATVNRTPSPGFD
jgi:hypothetical protein